MAAWWAYKQDKLQYRDVRVWLASFEVLARRCTMQTGRVPRFTLDELKKLAGGVRGEHMRASLRRLSSAGLLEWSETGVRQCAGDPLWASDDHGELAAKCGLLVNHRRDVPVPRRLLVFLASCPRPVLAATLLGHLLRCLYSRRKACLPTGLCKASWVADVFDVDARNVKRARGELVRLGILSTRSAPQWVLNRHGQPASINLSWSKMSTGESPPRRRLSTTQSPPPRRTGISLPRSQHQQPGAPKPDGVRISMGKPPSMKHVERRDLLDPARLDLLWRDAAHRGLVPATEHGRLQVSSAAARALRLARSSPPAFFAAIVRRGLWAHLSSIDEDRSRS